MPIVIGDRELMYRLGHELRRRGLWVAPVDYPAVPQNRICFRACVTANTHPRGSGRSAKYSRGHSRSVVAAKAKRLMMSQQVETRLLGSQPLTSARSGRRYRRLFLSPAGISVSEFFAHLKLTPAGVSLLAGVCGVMAGHLYFYRNLGINIAAWCCISARMRSTTRTVSLRG